jgi:hypothetical protein
MSIWVDPVGDLRIKLSDGPTDRLRAYKKVFGNQDGTNKLFKTFEGRRITDLTSTDLPLGVYVDGVPVTVSEDNVTTGYFTLQAAPANTAELVATYYVQYFLNAELDNFLRLSCNFLALGDDYYQIPGGLQNSALCYAAAEAYQKLAMRFADKMSDVYRLEDMPDKEREAIILNFKKSSEESRTEAKALRDDFYKNRQGQALAPLFGYNLGRVTDVPPNR